MSEKLEQQLKKALQCVEPPAGFAERVLARAARGEKRNAEPRPWLQRFGASGWRWAAVGALCAALAISGLVYHRERQKQGEQAKEQLMLALRITSSKLQAATASVQNLSLPDESQP
jgi:hypothetical protein